MNYRETCAFGLVCILLLANGSPCCTYHHLPVLYWVQLNPIQDRGQTARLEVIARESGYDLTVEYVRPTFRTEAGIRAIADIRKLHRIHYQYHVRTVDCEFATVSNAHCIPWIVTIRDVKINDLILSTPINYNNMELSDIENRLRAFRSTQDPPGSISHWCTAA